MILEQRFQRADQAAAAGLSFEFSILRSERDRDAIGNQDQVRRVHWEASTATGTEG